MTETKTDIIKIRKKVNRRLFDKHELEQGEKDPGSCYMGKVKGWLVDKRKEHNTHYNPRDDVYQAAIWHGDGCWPGDGWSIRCEGQSESEALYRAVAAYLDDHPDAAYMGGGG